MEDEHVFVTTDEAIANLTALKGQKQLEVDSMAVAVDLLVNGYKSDTETIATLRARIAELEAELAGGSHDIKVK